MKKKIYLKYMLVIIGLLFAAGLMTSAGAKSLYVCSNTNSNSTPIQAYNINPNGTFTYQAEYLTNFGWGSVGLAIDSNSGFLFLTQESSGILQLINGTTLLGEGQVTAPGADDLAGIVYDHGKELLYCVDRNTPYLYVYDWDPIAKSLTLEPGFPINLEGTSTLYGLALDEDNDILYASNYYFNVTYYNTNDWSLQGTIDLTHYTIGIGVDYKNGYLYTGAGWASDYYFTKYNLNTAVEYSELLPDGIMGIAIDQSTGYVYTTTGYGNDQLIAWDTTTTPFTQLDTTADIGDPAGLCIPIEEISYNPLNLNKEDGLDEGECVNIGGSLTYTIYYENANDLDVHNVTIDDSLPSDTTFVSATGGGTYDSPTHTVTWNIGTITAGSPQASVQVTVQIKNSAPAGGTITNYCTIESDETPPTTQSEITDICEGGGGDITPPTQDIILGMPRDEDVYYVGDVWLDRIGPNTPIWINSTDSESGTHNMTITVYWSTEFGAWTLIDTYYIVDNDPMDTDPTVGTISVLLYMEDTCFHEIHAFCYDNAGNEDTDRLDFIVDASPPISDSEYIGPLIIKNNVHYITNTTIKKIWAYDEGCIGGTGVCGIFWRVHDTDLNVVGEGTVYDGDTYTFTNGKILVTGDHDPDEGNITIEISILEDCIHYIYHQAIDCLGNQEERVKQMVKVDTKPPIVNKEVGLPNCDLLNGSYCITKDTPIWINVTDDPSNDPCVVESVHLKICYGYQETWITEWYNITSGSINHTFTFDQIGLGDDCMHWLCIWAEDDLGNSMGWHNESFFIDTMAPWINKTVGDPKLPYQLGPLPANPDYWVNCQTPITINAEDLGCCDQLAEVYYQINQSGWIQIPLSSLPYTLYFAEDCQHDLDIKAIDCLGNTAYHNETFYVDCTPPEIMKTVGDPNCTIIPGEEYCITTSTPITIYAEDRGCQGGVGLYEVKYRVWNQTHGWGPWMYDNDLNGDDYYFTEECTHYLHIIATDLLGNYIEDNETFHVDDTYPTIEKLVGDPNCTGELDADFCVKTTTPITINASDNGCCSDLTVKIQYGNDTWNSGWIDITSQLPDYEFYFTEECWHYLHIWAYDCLGHETHDNETFFVDDTPPEIIKTVGDPNCTCDDLEPGDYCVTLQTEITLDAQNLGCCPGPDVWIEYRIWYNGTWGSWIPYIEPFTFTEECMHYLEVRAWDCLNNTAYDNETFYVDETPPEIIKTVGDPNCIPCGGEEGDYCVNLTTPITLSATDECCICEVPTIEYRIWYMGFWTEWQNYTVPITFEEECMHYLEVRATDCLGNEATDNETFYVDDTPPELIKKVGEPNFTKDNKTWWVTTETEINLTGIEHGCCPCPWTEITYRIWYQGQWSNWILYTGNFTFTQGCTHYLEVKVKDCIGNYVLDNETFIVHGPSGPSGPTIEITYPIHGETYGEKTLEVIIHAYDGQTSWENLQIHLWQPGGRRDAPTLWYDVMLGDQQDYYKAYIDLFCYQNGAQITLWASAIDEDGNVQFALPVTFTVQSTVVWDQWMQPGWNLLILPPNIGCNESIPNILTSIDGAYDFVFHLDTVEGWISYWTNRTINELTEINGGKQYWVHITKASGLRYYVGILENEIQTPMDGAILTSLNETTGIAWHSYLNITSVHLQLYFKDSLNQKHYWNGSAWVTLAVNLPAQLDTSYPTNWLYDTSIVTWYGGETYYIKATATDESECTAVDIITFSTIGQCNASRTYTTDSDFDEGILANVEHLTVNDQLQLIPGEAVTYPVMWIANSGDPSVSKWDTENNEELARYTTFFYGGGSHSGPAPSRTCVDADGNCYVANRQFPSDKAADVIKILADDYIDRNGNGILDTSYDSSGNGYIEPGEMMPLTDNNTNNKIDDNEIQDERIAWAVEVGSINGLGRSLAIDLDGNLWLGLYNTQEYYKISGVDGSILAGPIDVSPHTPYGGLVDRNGILWGASLSTNLLKLDTNTNTVIDIFYHTDYGGNYGIALGYDESNNTQIYLGSYGGYTYIQFDSTTETFSTPADIMYNSRGIAVDTDGNILVGSTSSSGPGNGGVAKFAPNGTLIWSAPSQVGSTESRGTVVDSDNNVWCVHVSADKISKFKGTDGTALGAFDSGKNPYTYSDATGIGYSQSVISGTWTVIHDSGGAGTVWVTTSWTSSEPGNASITVKVRSSEDQISWSTWENADNGIALSTTTPGQYLEIQVTFKTQAGEDPPILYDLTVEAICESP